jgi:hypothetical protein
MSKQDQFLLLVQTALLANGINRSLDDDAKQHRHEFSAAGILGLMDEAVSASEQIPDRMTAGEAAWSFCRWNLPGLREAGDTLPGWIARA